MNTTEKQLCEDILGTSDGKTMEDYFDFLVSFTGGITTKDEFKRVTKAKYSSISDWSF